jgi:hypothetical protein
MMRYSRLHVRGRSARRLWAAAVLAACFLAGGAGQACADGPALGLDRTTYYDVYLAGDGESLSVIRNIKVMDVATYYGLEFLVVQPSLLSTTDSRGLILLSSIRAILPSNKIQNVPLQQRTLYPQ